MGSSQNVGRRTWRRTIVGVATLGLAAPLLSAAVAPAAAAGPPTTVLLTVAGDDLSVVTADVTQAGGQVLQAFPVASAVQVSLPAGVTPPPGTVVVPDQKLTFNSAATEAAADPVNTYRDTIGASNSLDGSGVTVALVDTGVADTGEIAVEHVNASGGPLGDGLGHGTFLAGLIAGNGASSNGAYRGVAPGAKVLDVQVATADGSTSMSQVLAGLQAVADRKAVDPSVKVLSLALSTGSPLPPWLDPLTRALERLWGEGITVVVSAGNDGADAVSSPASDPTLLAVGSVDENKTAARSDDTVAEFSAFEKTFGADRPDLVAPGVSLVSLKSPGSVADVENPGSSVGARYMKGTGTSMSSALTAGAVAGMLGQRPALSPNDVKRLVVGTAYRSSDLTQQTGAGAGGLDLQAATAARVDRMPKLAFEPVSKRHAPDEADAATWALFSEAWAAGDLRGVVAAWVKLSPQTRRWAANAWSLAVLVRSLSLPEGDFLGRSWAGRRWSVQSWSGRRWSEDSWVGRRWSIIDWGSQEWAESTWLTEGWAGRRWSSSDWLAFAWTVRASADSSTIEDLWTDEEFDGRRWSGRRWSQVDWAGRRWSEEAWDGRRWSDFVFDGRRWSDEEWDGRRWSGRRWSDEDWDGRRWSGRRWSDEDWAGRRWSGRRWSEDEWDGRRWSDFAFEGRRWSTETWTGHRWSVTGWEL